MFICVNELADYCIKKGYKAHNMHIGGGYNFDFGRLKFTIAHHGSKTPDGEYGGEPAGVILTGGGAKLPGIRDIAKKQLKLPCRIGTSKISYNFQEDPGLSVLCGLVLEGIETEKENIVPIGKGIMGKFKRMFKTIIP